MQGESTKRCTKCGKDKPLDAFTPDKNAPTGRAARCRPCRNADQRERYHREGEAELVKLRAYVARNIEAIRPRKREDMRRSRAADPERARAKSTEASRALRARDPDYFRRYYAANVERGRELARHRSASRRARIPATATALAEYMTELLALPCAYCGATVDMTVDHVVPLARGGTHSAENLVAACRPCNSSKHTRLLSEWEGPRRTTRPY